MRRKFHTHNVSREPRRAVASSGAGLDGAIQLSTSYRAGVLDGPRGSRRRSAKFRDREAAPAPRPHRAGGTRRSSRRPSADGITTGRRGAGYHYRTTDVNVLPGRVGLIRASTLPSFGETFFSFIFFESSPLSHSFSLSLSRDRKRGREGEKIPRVRVREIGSLAREIGATLTTLRRSCD